MYSKIFEERNIEDVWIRKNLVEHFVLTILNWMLPLSKVLSCFVLYACDNCGTICKQYSIKRNRRQTKSK